MVGVGGHALQPVGQQFAQAAHVGIQLRVGHDAGRRPLLQQSLQGRGRDEPDRRGQLPGAGKACGGKFMVFLFQGLLYFFGPVDPLFQAPGVEVDVGHGGEQRLDDKAVGAGVGVAELAQALAQEADAFQLVQKQVLQHGHFRALAADAEAGAGLAIAGLFALVAKHVHG